MELPYRIARGSSGGGYFCLSDEFQHRSGRFRRRLLRHVVSDHRNQAPLIAPCKEPLLRRRRPRDIDPVAFAVQHDGRRRDCIEHLDHRVAILAGVQAVLVLDDHDVGTTERVDRRGKYLIVRVSSGETLIMHLGMSGWFDVVPTGDRSREADPHDHVIFVMSSGRTVVFNDPRRFGFMDLAGAGRFDDYPSLRVMGPEPLSRQFNPGALARACRGKKTSLKVALLDQRIVGGLGNIYASEALHHAKLSPLRLASTIATVSSSRSRRCPRTATTAPSRPVDAASLLTASTAEHNAFAARAGVAETPGTEAAALLRGLVRRIAERGRLAVDPELAAQMVQAANSGVVLLQIGTPEPDRDPGLSPRTREAVIAAITTGTEGDAPEGPGAGGTAAAQAIALRAGVGAMADRFSPAELSLLTEWLGRIARG